MTATATAPTAANPNAVVNGWCPSCEEWAVRGRENQCMFCDSPLTDPPPAAPEPEPEIEPTPDRPLARRRGNRFRRSWTDEAVFEAAARWREGTGAAPSRADWNPALLKRRVTAARERLRLVGGKLALYASGEFPSESTVRDRFGSMNAMNAQAFAHFRPRSTGRQPLSDHSRRKWTFDLEALWGTVTELRDAGDRPEELREAMYDLAQALVVSADRIHRRSGARA